MTRLTRSSRTILAACFSAAWLVFATNLAMAGEVAVDPGGNGADILEDTASRDTASLLMEAVAIP